MINNAPEQSFSNLFYLNQVFVDLPLFFEQFIDSVKIGRFFKAALSFIALYVSCAIRYSPFVNLFYRPSFAMVYERRIKLSDKCTFSTMTSSGRFKSVWAKFQIALIPASATSLPTSFAAFLGIVSATI